MPQLTSVEVKELSSYLKESLSEVSDSIQRGKFLNIISRASGFRDWNTMTACVPEHPEVAWGEWGYVLIGFAIVCVPGQEPTYHMVHARSRVTPPREVAERLALSVSARWKNFFQGRQTVYSKLDSRKPDAPFLVLDRDSTKKLKAWNVKPPIRVVAFENGVNIWLWWLHESYTMAESYPEKERRFRLHSLTQETLSYSQEPLTEAFLASLTGIKKNRKCFYSTERPNRTYGKFVLIEVREGFSDGVETGHIHFDAESAALHAQELNRKLGLSQRDVNDISACFSMYDPYHEEDIFDDYSHGND